MIRLKNNVLPVWFQFDGDEAQLERAKQTIIDDITMNGFKHYTTFVDIMEQPTEEEKNWDGTADATITLTPESKTNPGLPSSNPNMDKFADNVEETTDTKVVGADTEPVIPGGRTAKKKSKSTEKTAS